MPKKKLLTHQITPRMLPAFIKYLHTEERSENTIEKYVRYTREFISWADGAPISKGVVIAWKESLQNNTEFAPATVNAKLASVNAFFKFAGWDDCRVKSLRLQRQVFRDPSKDLTREEYTRLIQAAYDKGDERLAMVMETLCSTAIRVSEIKYITVEAVKQGQTVIKLKGKVRTIILPGKLCKKLLKYIQKNKIASGEVFLTRSGKGMSRRQIWAEMKGICKAAGVEASKVFPHNLRHLFARAYYTIYHDIAKLADMLGHSSIETTRIYLISTGKEHARQMDRLGFVV